MVTIAARIVVVDRPCVVPAGAGRFVEQLGKALGAPARKHGRDHLEHPPSLGVTERRKQAAGRP
jgi:hypothetical protein